jgi:CRISPR-associated protein Csm3
MELFGYSGDSTKKEVSQTRLLVRDAFLKNEDASIFNKGFTDSKWENVINRKTGTAEHPRQLERVPVGASFGLELVYNIFEDKSIKTTANATNVNKHLQGILLALQLLQDDGIGGSISRGYGQVKVNIEEVDYKMIDPEKLTYKSVKPVDTTQQQLLAEFTTEFSPIK